MRVVKLVLLSVLASLALAAAPAAQARTELNVIPHGEAEPGVPWLSAPGILPADTQARMYDRLTPLFRRVGPAQLVPSEDGSGYFKSAALVPRTDPSLVTSETLETTLPGGRRVSALVRRDRYGVPHIYSDSDAGAIYAAGWVCATDRNLLLDQARFNGVAALVDLPGAPAIELILGLYDYRPSRTVVRQATRLQTRNIARRGAPGRLLLRDIDVYLAGINAWYRQNKPTAPTFTRTDIYALNAVKGQFLGEGGGQEVPNALLLDGLQRRLGASRGTGAWEDLRGRNDPETTTTTSRRAPWQTDVSPARARGAVGLQAGSFRSAAVSLPGRGTAGAAAARGAPRGPHARASNILIASGRRSRTGSPLFVGGPQIGFNYPGLTFEEQIESPSIRVRGATSAPFPGYALIGRGRDFAFTLTSAGADIVDTYAERLCGGARRRYRFRGRCRAMERVDAGTIAKGGETARASFHRSVHGPLIGYARERGSGRLVALTQRRSSYGQDTVDQLFNQALTYGRVRDARSFIRAAQQTPQTFNSFFAGATESAFYTSGRLPLRPRGVDPDLPTDGGGRFEWRGYLDPDRHPQERNPRSGLIVNWNNKPAKDFPASDERWSEQSIQRVDLLRAELDRHGRALTLDEVLDAANAAATQDVRIMRLWPTLKRVLDRGRAPSTQARAAVRTLDAWRRAGGSRVDADRDGSIDQAGAAILDAAWTGMARNALCPTLGRALCSQLAERNAIFDRPPGGQYSGWHQYLWKDLRAQLGDRVRGAYRVRYCGRGSLARCSRTLWAALDAAGRRLTAQQRTPDPARWRKSTKPERIEFSPLPLIEMQYTNRPSGIHQVMEFGR